MISQRFPADVRSFTDPRLETWREIYGWIKHVDTVNTNILIDSSFKNFTPTKECRVVICSSFESLPGVAELINLANQYKDLIFVWLTDSDIYDFSLPKNVRHVKYRHWHLRVKTFLELYPIEKLCRAKDKLINHKFSSLSYYPRQNRAVITAALLTFAKNQTILSWRKLMPIPSGEYDKRVTVNFDYQLHWNLINSFKNDDRFAELDWTTLDQTITIDDYSLNNNYVEYNMIDIHNPCYQNALINFSNETNSYGYYNDGTVSYTRPGPYLTEKTLKTLITGTVLINSAQPHVYEFLKNDYNLPIDYSFDILYDSQAGDFDRFHSVVNLIKSVSQQSLKDLIDQNIDNCQLIQNTLLSPDWMDQINLYNKQQDSKILNILETV
jgi:hypothetical protein